MTPAEFFNSVAGEVVQTDASPIPFDPEPEPVTVRQPLDEPEARVHVVDVFSKGGRQMRSQIAEAIRAHAYKVEAACGNDSEWRQDLPVINELRLVAEAVARFEPISGKRPRLKFGRRNSTKSR